MIRYTLAITIATAVTIAVGLSINYGVIQAVSKLVF